MPRSIPEIYVQCKSARSASCSCVNPSASLRLRIAAPSGFRGSVTDVTTYRWFYAWRREYIAYSLCSELTNVHEMAGLLIWQVERSHLWRNLAASATELESASSARGRGIWDIQGVQSLSRLRTEVAGLAKELKRCVCSRGKATVAIFLIISAVALLFLAPGYWVFAVVTFFVTGILAANHVISGDVFRGLVTALAVGGWVRCGYRFWNRIRSKQQQQANWRTEQASLLEAAERRREQASLREAAEQEQKVSAEKKLDALRARRREERQGILNENKELLDQVAEMLASCRAPVLEMLRATKAFSGEDVVRPPELFLLIDIVQIILRIVAASGSDVAVAARLFAGIQIRIEPSIRSDYGINEALQKLREFDASIDRSLKTPAMVPLLASYDKIQGTYLAAKAARTYLSIIESASACCGRSVAVKMIANTYAELLKPFTVSDNWNKNAGQSSTASGGPAGTRAPCANCAQSYRILGLPLKSGPDAVKSKRRAFAEFLHPDQLGSKSEQARRAAEEQLKNVNEACDHILHCQATN